MKVRVASSGPLTARILWVGEAPGSQEVLKNEAFVGPTGQIARRTLRWAGIDVDNDVRFTNVCRHNPGKFPTGEAGFKLLTEYANELDDEIAQMPNLKIIVACGGPALTRLTGRRSLQGNGWGINEWRGSVFRRKDLPDVLTWSSKARHYHSYPPNIIIIPTLHPAGIIRSKGRDDITLLRRDIVKIRKALNNALEKVNYEVILNPDLNVLEAARANATKVFIDTEFQRDTKQVFWVGLTFDGYTTFGFGWTPYYVNFVVDILKSNLLKCAHNIVADAEALEKSLGTKVSPPWWDTMISQHALHPALEVGLDDAARFYIDDILNWKDMSTSDPYYNAMDVAYGWKVMVEQLRDASDRPVDINDELHARMKLVHTTWSMTQRGMPISVAVQTSLRADAEKEMVRLNELIQQQVRPYWDERVRKSWLKVQTYEKDIAQLRAPKSDFFCMVHRTYNGLRKPSKKCTVCQSIYASPEIQELKPKLLTLRKLLAQAKSEASRWDNGFDSGNNEHLRWLLYHPEALKLPVQKSMSTGRISADRTAVDKLAMSTYVKRFPATLKLVLDIKRVQQLEKAISTFINVPIDDNYVAHPRYKVHGTRTGRLAGGKDDDEKAAIERTFNPLNIPREWRRMYIPPKGHVFVAADWRNVEGRLTAHFCKDAHYTEVLANELTGGPKVHSVNAGIIYNIDPKDAKKVKVMLNGLERDAYDGGKRLTHAWSYGMQPPHMMRTFNISLEEAVRIDLALSTAYPTLVNWRKRLVDEVLGIWEPIPGDRKLACIKEGRRLMVNPFGWQLRFLGIERSQANEVLAFLPQSTGAGMWTRCAPLLEERYPIFTGTYDSFVLCVPKDISEIQDACEALTSIMERPWAELDNKTFPIEISQGENWGDFHADENPYGLKKVA